MIDLIRMDRKYAYRHAPETEVRILCVDVAGKCPVISVTSDGLPLSHNGDGMRGAMLSSEYDLVPLERKPREWWVKLFPCGKMSVSEAEPLVLDGTVCSEIVRVIERFHNE